MFKNQKGFTAIAGLLLMLILATVGFGGYYIWDQNRDKKTDSSTANTATNEVPKSGEDEEQVSADATSDWQTYTDAYAGYTVKFPKDWYRQTNNTDLCSDGLVLLASKSELLGKCATDSGGEVIITANLGKNFINEAELAPDYYPDLKEKQVTINGVTGKRQIGTFKQVHETDVGIGPTDGDVTVKYIFYKNNNTYIAIYSLPKGSENNIEIFDLIVTKGFAF